MLQSIKLQTGFRPKFYINEFRKTGKASRQLLTSVDKVIKDLNLLIDYSPTAERLNMLGSAYKSKAMMSAGKVQKVNAYKQSAVYYYKAYSRQKKAYSLTNWLEIETILILLDARKWGQTVRAGQMEYDLPVLKDAVKDLESLFDSLTSFSTDELSYWDWASAANIKLCLLMLEFKAAGYNSPTYEEIFNLYKETWDKAGSKGKKLGELDHFDFLIDALSISRQKNSVVLKNKITDMRNQLQKMI